MNKTHKVVTLNIDSNGYASSVIALESYLDRGYTIDYISITTKAVIYILSIPTS